MNNDYLLGARILDKEQIRHVSSAIGRRIECLSGSLWITQNGDRRDIVLEPGEAFDFDHADGFVGALSQSRYLLLQPCARTGA